jgi:hypothetical protein
MSRRHHGGRPHRANGPGRPIDTSRPLPIAQPEHQAPVNGAPAPGPDAHGLVTPTVLPGERIRATATAASVVTPSAEPAAPPAPPDPAVSDAQPAVQPDREGGEPLSRVSGPNGTPANGQRPTAAPAIADRPPGPNGSRQQNGPIGIGGACTAPQLRRFIKSRPYVPMHELRRRFGIDGVEDDVTPVDLMSGRIFVGLPAREGSLLGELLRGGEVGFELSLDPRSPVVIGLYPMRPVARN